MEPYIGLRKFGVWLMWGFLSWVVVFILIYVGIWIGMTIF